MKLRGLCVVSLLAFATASADAQAPASVRRIAYLGYGSSAASGPLESFRQGLRELGSIEGKNLVIDYRWAEGEFERLPSLAADLIQRKPNVIVATGYHGIQAAREVAGPIPIVMIACDPAETIVSSIARPGGTITGVTCMSSDLTPKRLQLLKEALPKLARVAVLFNAGDPNKAGEFRQMLSPARALGLSLQPFEVRDAGEIERAFASIARARPGALFVLPEPFTVFHREQITALAAKAGLPAMYGYKEFVEVGGLMSYGTPMADLFRRAAVHTDKILKGTFPGDLPVEQAMRFELFLNAQAAKALGIRFPQSIVLRADRVIE